ncbi:DUF11 domain-containing protein [Ottowia thiooxydans]|uniref:Repeat protein (TIGR01451 family) n=1 Tax=Ottowia thiooxydans TaxID=219182 RepID=A0ABV2Q2M6_9BURK
MTLDNRACSSFATLQSHSVKKARRALCLFAVTVMAAPGLAMAQTTCDGSLFLSQGDQTQLNRISTATSPMTFTPIGTNDGWYNSLGMSPDGTQLYALSIVTNGNDFLTVDPATGAVTAHDIDLVSGTPFNAGTVGSDGVYYVKMTGDNDAIAAINVTTKAVTWIALDQSIQISDLAWVGGAGGGLYAVGDNGQLYSINLATAPATVTAIGTPDATGGVLGAQFGGVNGLFGSANDGSGFYKINLTTGKKTLISSAPGSGTNDGANCPNAVIAFPAELVITKTDGNSTYAPGSDVVYTITVQNNGPFAAIDTKVTDALPAGITTANWTCSATGGATCQASGSGAIDDIVTLPKDGIVTYQLTLKVPANFTGNLVNTATAAPGPDNTGSSVSATDTNTRAGGSTAGTTTAVPALGGLGALLLSGLVAGAAGLTRRKKSP